MIQKTSLILFASALLFACQKDQDTAGAPKENTLQLSKMEVGQKNYYLRLSGEGFRDQPPFTSEYLPDTLVLEVTAVDGDVFTLKEYLTPGSASILTPDKVTPPPNGSGEYVYKVKVADGKVQYVGMVSGQWRPHLFPKETMVLSLSDITGQEIKLSGWMPGADVTVNQAYLLDFQLGKSTYDRLNFVRDYNDMAFDGTGYFYLYNEKVGIVRVGYVSSWGMPGMAWDLME